MAGVAPRDDRAPIAPSGPDCTVGPDRASIAPSGLESGPDRGPTQSGPVNCTKLASPSFAIDAVAIRMLRKTGVELYYGWLGLHHGTIGARLRRRAPIRARLRCHSGILSNTGGKDGPGRSARILGGCGAVGDIARVFFLSVLVGEPA